jgi:hypothetical protein
MSPRKRLLISGVVFGTAVAATVSLGQQPSDAELVARFEALQEQVIVTRHMEPHERSVRLAEVEREMDACTILSPDDRAMLLTSMAQRSILGRVRGLGRTPDLRATMDTLEAARRYERAFSLSTQVRSKMFAAAEATRAFDEADQHARAIAIGRDGLEFWRSSPQRSDPNSFPPGFGAHSASSLGTCRHG